MLNYINKHSRTLSQGNVAEMHVETDERVCCPQLFVGVFPLICAASAVLQK